MNRILEYYEAEERENVRKNGIMNNVKYYEEINKIKLKKVPKEIGIIPGFWRPWQEQCQQSDKDRNQVATGCTKN